MTSLYIDRKGVRLEAKGEALILREPDGTAIGAIPLAPVSRVILKGDVHLPVSLLGKLGQRQIPVLILSGRNSEASLLLGRSHQDARLRLAQYKLFHEPATTLNRATALVEHKLHTHHDFLLQTSEQLPEHRYALTKACRIIAGIRQKLSQHQTLDQLRGGEGAAAAAYFAGYSAILPPAAGFTERNRRPPRDPVNAALSLGYTLLHNEAVIRLYSHGFDPYIGYYHQPETGRESLASDLIEPLRWLIDRMAWRMFSQKTLRTEHFTTTAASCLMGKSARLAF